MHRDYLEEVKKLLRGKDYTIVGKNVRRVDALEKVTGRAKYTTDFFIENALIVRPVRSPYSSRNHQKRSIRRLHCVFPGLNV